MNAELLKLVAMRFAVYGVEWEDTFNLTNIINAC